MDVVALQAAKADAAGRYDSIATPKLRRRHLPRPSEALAVDGEVPTVTASATELVASGTTYAPKRIGNVTGADMDLPGDPAFLVGGTIGMVSNATSRVRPTIITGGAGVSARYTPTLHFYTDAQAFEYIGAFTGTAFDYRLVVDGKLAVVDGHVTTTGSFGNILFDFGSAKTRHIALSITDPDFFGIRVATTYSVWRPTQPFARRLFAIGDSITRGTQLQATQPWCWDLARMLGCDDVWNVGIGGTSWGATDGTQYGARLAADLVPILQPNDVVVFFGSRNDPSGSGAALATVTAAVTAALNQIPSVKNVFVATNITNITGLAGAVVAGATAAGRPGIDASGWMTGTGNVGSRTVTDGVLNSTTTLTSATAVFIAGDVGAVITGTGIPAGTTIAARVSATQVTLSAAATATASGVSVTVTNQHLNGNSDRYITNDAVHPTLAGHRYMARRWDAEIRALLPA